MISVAPCPTRTQTGMLRKMDDAAAEPGMGSETGVSLSGRGRGQRGSALIESPGSPESMHTENATSLDLERQIYRFSQCQLCGRYRGDPSFRQAVVQGGFSHSSSSYCSRVIPRRS